jgi:hypothetical protein
MCYNVTKDYSVSGHSEAKNLHPVDDVFLCDFAQGSLVTALCAISAIVCV